MKKVLIVDDEPGAREILDDFLTFQGFETIQAVDGIDGLEKFHQQQPQAAIVDLEMPGMNGQFLAKQIIQENKDFPIIIISAFLNNYVEKDFTDLGVYAVLEKPIDLKEINMQLQNIFKQSA